MTRFDEDDDEISHFEDYSDDDGFNDDLEALRRACIIIGKDPNEFTASKYDVVETKLNRNDVVSDRNSDSDDDEDLALLRKIRSQLSSSTEVKPLSLKPLSTLLPPESVSDEEEDDYQTPSLFGNASLHTRITVIRKLVQRLLILRANQRRKRVIMYLELMLMKGLFHWLTTMRRDSGPHPWSGISQIPARHRLLGSRSLRWVFLMPLIRIGHVRSFYKARDRSISVMSYGPEENADVAKYRKASTNYPLSLDRRTWSEEEKKDLQKGIRQQFQEMMLRSNVDESSHAETQGDSNEIDKILASIKDLEITPYSIREFLPKVNWEQLATMYLPGRSGGECEARWLNWEDSLMNHEPWTKEEDKKILYLVMQKNGVNDWNNIAVSQGTNRTPFQCLARYQRSLILPY